VCLGRIVRVGVTFPSELLSDFDGVVEGMGYGSRSKAIQDVVRGFVSEQKWLVGVKGTRAGVITMVYNHEMRDVEADLTDTQHHFEGIICASMHVHLSKDKCLETIAVRGEAQEIKRLVEKLKARRGVEEVRLNLFSLQDSAIL
jgi:CopG family nickel-responsive transcriptional regulator